MDDEFENFAKREKEELAQQCQKYYSQLMAPLRDTAKALGYALAVHGSIARDIDLIAAPWIPDAAAADVLAEELEKTCIDVVGSGYLHLCQDNPEKKPHGRLGFVIYLAGGPYLDVSIMPRVTG